MNLDLKNKNAIVCGSTQGIGQATAVELANLGANITLIARNESKLKEVMTTLDTSQGQQHSFLVVDFSDSKILKEKIDALNDNYHILINNTGGPAGGPIIDANTESFEDAFQMHLINNQILVQKVFEGMKKECYGRIINIASIAGKEGNPNASAYSTAKAGVIGLTKSLGKELSNKNIAVNAVTPAAAKTRIFDQMTKEHIDYMLSKIPRNRFVLVEELASLVAWLASEENSYTTGAVFDLSGGRATY